MNDDSSTTDPNVGRPSLEEAWTDAYPDAGDGPAGWVPARPTHQPAPGGTSGRRRVRRDLYRDRGQAS
jgi:hypothetical protein